MLTSSSSPEKTPLFKEAARFIAPSMRARCNDFLRGAYDFIERHPEEWVLDHDVDLEVTNHVLRVWIQDGTIAQHILHVDLLCKHQHADGGWGDTRDDSESRLRSTAFSAQMLLRANRKLKKQRFGRAIRNALDFIVRNQLDDGSWRDHRWHQLDAVSVSVGTLLFAVNEPEMQLSYAAALDRGMTFIRNARDDQSRLWFYNPSGSPVTISSHLLQKCATQGPSGEFIISSAHALLDLQDPAGHWDNANIDHTCDASRCLLVCASMNDDIKLIDRVSEAVTRSLSWILNCAIDGGLGNRPRSSPHVERTCDGIDTILKFAQFVCNRKRIIRFWQ